MGEEFVEVDFAEDGAQGGLGELRGLVDVVRDLDDGLDGIDDAQGDDGVDLEGDVVARDDVLRGDLHRFLAERDADDLVERAKDEDDPGTRGVVPHAAEPEDDSPLVLLQDLDAIDDIKNDDGDEYEERKADDRHGTVLDTTFTAQQAEPKMCHKPSTGLAGALLA